MRYLIFPLLLFPTFALSQEIYCWQGRGEPSCVELKETKEPGAKAEVYFENKSVHPSAYQTVVIQLGDLEVEVTITTNTQGADDTFTVVPEEGYIAIPPELVVPEEGVGRIVIYEGGIG